MATIYLVRHGQASFGKENYDQLSPRGWEQGKILGRWLADKVEPGAIFGGNLQRHRETVEAIATGYGSALPGMQVLEGLNEFDHLQVVERLRPEWADKQVMARDLASFPKPAKAFQQAFERSEEHTSELQSRPHLVCRLLLEKKNLLLCSYLTRSLGRPRRSTVLCTSVAIGLSSSLGLMILLILTHPISTRPPHSRTCPPRPH